MKRNIAALFLLWTGVIIAAYYVVQKPSLLTAFTGIADTLWTLLVAAILLFNAYGIGRRVLHALKFDSQDSVESLLFSGGIGLGALGLLGLLFSALQLANEKVLSLFQITLAIVFLFQNDLKILRAEIRAVASNLNLSFGQYNFFTKLAVLLPISFSFLLTLAPPFEAFDALSYHLAQPARILQDGGLRAVDVPAFWYPNITENVYLWTLAFHSERAAQMLHFAWAILSIILLWHWAVKIWGIEIGRKTVLLVMSVSSLPLLSSWVYADMALVYYAVAALYALSFYQKIQTKPWLYLMGMMAGLAMSVKYTSFVVPLTCGLLLLLKHPWKEAIKSAVHFSGVAFLIALPWYVRNQVVMHNPFYPFVFNGLYWDSFRGIWYSNAGTGIGWDFFQIAAIPINMMLGYRELSPTDGRMGPLFLVLLPFTLWIFLLHLRRDSTGSGSLINIGVFVALSFIAWTMGVINSMMVWQVRFFYPALLPFAIPTALSWDSLILLDTARLRISFLMNGIVVIVLALTMFDNGLFLLQRNPLLYALGIQSRTRYIERVNPSYAALMQIMDELPRDANIYSLFEPRSYSLPRSTQPDLALYNFSHDLFLFKTPDAIIQHWKSEGYSHVLVYERGLILMTETEKKDFPSSTQQTLSDTLGKLKFVNQTPDKVYSIYQIP